jgi:hypothetical protein
LIFYLLKIFVTGGRDRRIMVQGQSEQMLAEPYFKNKLNMVKHVCGPSYFRGGSRIEVRYAQGEICLILKTN